MSNLFHAFSKLISVVIPFIKPILTYPSPFGRKNVNDIIGRPLMLGYANGKQIAVCAGMLKSTYRKSGTNKTFVT